MQVQLGIVADCISKILERVDKTNKLIGGPHLWEGDSTERRDNAQHDDLPHVQATLPVEQFERKDNVEDEHDPHYSSEIDACAGEEVSVVDSLDDVKEEEDEIDRREDRSPVEGLHGSRCMVVGEFEDQLVVDMVPFEHEDVQGENPHVNKKKANASPNWEISTKYWVGVQIWKVQLLQCYDESDNRHSDPDANSEQERADRVFLLVFDEFSQMQSSYL